MGCAEIYFLAFLQITPHHVIIHGVRSLVCRILIQNRSKNTVKFFLFWEEFFVLSTWACSSTGEQLLCKQTVVGSNPTSST